MGSQQVGHDLVTENQTPIIHIYILLYIYKIQLCMYGKYLEYSYVLVVKIGHSLP